MYLTPSPRLSLATASAVRLPGRPVRRLSGPVLAGPLLPSAHSAPLRPRVHRPHGGCGADPCRRHRCLCHAVPDGSDFDFIRIPNFYIFSSFARSSTASFMSVSAGSTRCGESGRGILISGISYRFIQTQENLSGKGGIPSPEEKIDMFFPKKI